MGIQQSRRAIYLRDSQRRRAKRSATRDSKRLYVNSIIVHDAERGENLRSGSRDGPSVRPRGGRRRGGGLTCVFVDREQEAPIRTRHGRSGRGGRVGRPGPGREPRDGGAEPRARSVLLRRRTRKWRRGPCARIYGARESWTHSPFWASIAPRTA